MGSLGGTRIIAAIRPWDSADTYPSHEALYGKGGLRTVNGLDDRSAISTDRKEAGMIVYVISQSLHYQLQTDLSSWSTFGGGSSTIDEISSIGNVTISTVSADDILSWAVSASAWINKENPAGSATVTEISNIGNVVIIDASGLDVLTYDNSAGVWTNKASSAAAPLVDYVSHLYNLYGHKNQAYDADLASHYDVGPIMVVDKTGEMVYT